MDHGIFGELSLIVCIATAISFVMYRLKQPLIIGYIITGLLVGPLGFDIVHAEDTVELFSMLGIALLLFIIGLGLNPKVIKDLGKVAFFTAGLQMAATTALGYFTGLLFGLNNTTSLIVGVTISFSSTIIILKIISDKKEQNRLYGRLAIGLLLVQDIAATIALLLLSTSNGDGFTLNDATLLLVKGGLLGGGLYLTNRFIITPAKKHISASQEFLFLFAVGWGLGVPALFEIAGFSFEVGALFAGVTLANQPYAQEISAKLRPLRDFFIVLFFVELGLNIQLTGLVGNIPLIISLCLLVLIVKPILVMYGLGFMGYTKRTAFMTGATMAQVSEFSIVFVTLTQSAGHINNEIVSALIIVSLITIAASTYIMKYSEKIFLKYEDKITLFENRLARSSSKVEGKYDVVIFGYKKGGAEFAKTFTKIKKRLLVIDYDPLAIDSLERQGINHLYGDATDTELLEEVGVENAKMVVATFTDHPSSMFLVEHLVKANKRMIILLNADNPEDAQELYEAGATYVMLPHYIGSEKLSSFIKKHGLKKSEFNKWRDKHLSKIEKID